MERSWYGTPTIAQTILDNIIDLKEDCSFWLDQSYFDYCTCLRMTNERFDALFGAPARGQETLLTQREMDLAAQPADESSVATGWRKIFAAPARSQISQEHFLSRVRPDDDFASRFWMINEVRKNLCRFMAAQM